MSLLEPSAWYVLEPSKFHSGRSEKKETLSRIHQMMIQSMPRVMRTLTFDTFGLVIQCLSFAAESLSCSINPNIHGLNLIPLWEVHVLLFHSFAQGGTGRCGHF